MNEMVNNYPDVTLVGCQLLFNYKQPVREFYVVTKFIVLIFLLDFINNVYCFMKIIVSRLLLNSRMEEKLFLFLKMI